MLELRTTFAMGTYREAARVANRFPFHLAARDRELEAFGVSMKKTRQGVRDLSDLKPTRQAVRDLNDVAELAAHVRSALVPHHLEICGLSKGETARVAIVYRLDEHHNRKAFEELIGAAFDAPFIKNPMEGEPRPAFEIVKIVFE